MNEDVLSFTKIKINHDLLDEIWSLDPKTLDRIDGAMLSSYALCLSQYLVYFTYQRNLSKAEQHRLTKYVDRTVSLIMSSNDFDSKKFKTKAAALDYIVSTNEDLMDENGWINGGFFVFETAFDFTDRFVRLGFRVFVSDPDD